jgi:hypothetical protein
MCSHLDRRPDAGQRVPVRCYDGVEVAVVAAAGGCRLFWPPCALQGGRLTGSGIA